MACYLCTFSRAIVYAISGLLLHLAILVGALVLAPFVWMGLRIGQRIHLGLTTEQLSPQSYPPLDADLR